MFYIRLNKVNIKIVLSGTTRPRDLIFGMQHRLVLFIQECSNNGIYFNIVDLCGILPYKRMYPYKCGIKINFDILTTQKDQ